MYGEKYPARVEVDRVSDDAFVWMSSDPEDYGLGHEHYGERPPATTRRDQTEQVQVVDEVQ